LLLLLSWAALSWAALRWAALRWAALRCAAVLQVALAVCCPPAQTANEKKKRKEKGD
jgi:hypothetical protein